MKYPGALLFSFLLLVHAGVLHAEQPVLTAGQDTMQVSGGHIWYHVMGDGQSPFLLMLHGGPGGTAHSMYALGPLADNYTLIIFDQIGTGRSGSLTDTTLMNMNYFVGQLREFVEGLGLDTFFIYGHSWGTMLALDYYLAYPEGIGAMIMNSPLVSTEMWMRDADTLIATLDAETRAAIDYSEKTGNYETMEYQRAMYVYYRNFIGRGGRIKNSYGVERVPGNSLMYNYMWGPSEFSATGTLRNYNRLDKLSALKIPVLWVTGEYDEARPATVRQYHNLTPRSTFRIIPDAAHATMHDNRDENVRVIREFLDETGKH